MEFKQDDSCSVQKSSCFLEIPFFLIVLDKGYTLKYNGEIKIDFDDNKFVLKFIFSIKN